VAEDGGGIGLQAADFFLGIGVERPEVVVVVVVRHPMAEQPPESFDGSAVRVGGGGVHQPEGVAVARQGLPDQAGPGRRVGSGVVPKDDGDPSSGLRARCQVVELEAQRLSVAAGLKPKESQPSRQFTAPKPRHFRLFPGARTRRWPRRPFRLQTRVSVGCKATWTSSWR